MSRIKITVNEIFDLQQFAIKLGLENISKLAEIYNNPQWTYPTIHIAGTNGKGSTAIILQKILIRHGLKVGLFTSPHLLKFNERIRINNTFIDDNFIADFWKDIKNQVLNIKATFFDTTTCMAFEFFKQNAVDLAIFETGLGGRLDSTNIIKPEIAIITPIDFDHQKQLGNSLKQIAYEKAGIIKENSKVIIAKQRAEVNQYFKDNFKSDSMCYFEDQIYNLKIKTNIKQTHFEFYDKINNRRFDKCQLNLLGAFQAENACVAYMAGDIYLKRKNMKLYKKKFYKSLLTVNWPGRLNKIIENPAIYLDVSHNVDGFRKSIDFIKSKFSKSNSFLILGLLEDKNYKEIVNIVKDVFGKIWIVEPNNHRKLNGQLLVEEFSKNNNRCDFIKDLNLSFETIIRDLLANDTLFIMGSHYLAEQILSLKHKIT